MTATQAPLLAIKPIAELFVRSSALWATTYSLDLSLFNEFLFPRLGEPPLNVVILADHRRLSESLNRIPAERVDALAAVNRRWLLRAVRIGSQTFHPKSYLTISGKQATLLIGSGNLSAKGLEEGYEVFTLFRTGTVIGDLAVLAWREWMRRLIEQVQDVALAERFHDLEQRLPAKPSVATSVRPVLHNLDTPIASQLTAVVTQAGVTHVDELLLAAPYFDKDAEAVGKLLTALRPDNVEVYVTGSTSVNGGRLAERLSTSGARVRIVGYEPDGFVHAKLVGVISGHNGWLLSGSANLSLAALTLTPRDGGNVELAVVARVDPDQVRWAFAPPGLTLSARTLESLAALRFAPDADPPLPPVRLMTAVRATDGRVEVRSDPPASGAWLLDDLATHQSIIVEASGRAVTSRPVVGRLVQLVGADAAVLSNRVVVDDPAALAAALTAGTDQPISERPPEFAASDLATPLAQALVWLHRNLVMDVTERITTNPTGGVGANEADEQADDELWERLEREQLARDPRAAVYGRIWTPTMLTGNDPLIELIEALSDRAPTGPAGKSLLVHLLAQLPPPGATAKPPTHRWKPSTRIRVRTRNVLRRWAAAQTDPRLMWVDPLGPAGNFAMIAFTLWYLRLMRASDPDVVELSDEDLDDIWLWWLRPFVGTGAGDGWLGQLNPDLLELARQRLPEWLPEASAALCWLAVRPGGDQRERIIVWQPILASALNNDLINATDGAAQYLTAITASTVTPDEIDDLLIRVIEFVDDPLWCARTAKEFGVNSLELQSLPGAAASLVRLEVGGLPDPLFDARVPRLIMATRRYRRCDGVALYDDAERGWRLVAVTGEPVGYKPNDHVPPLDSINPLGEGVIEQLSRTGGVLAGLFPQTAEVA